MKDEMSDKCENCGGDYAIHNAKTNKCPLGGKAPDEEPRLWEDTVFKITSELEAENQRLRAALQTSYDAINSLPEDAFGTAINSDGSGWYLRDEILHNIAKALKETE